MKKISQILYFYNKNKIFYLIIFLQFIVLLLTINIIFLKNANNNFATTYASQIFKPNDIYVFNESSDVITEEKIVAKLHGTYELINVKKLYAYYNDEIVKVVAYESKDLAIFKMPMHRGKWLSQKNEFVAVNFEGNIKNRYNFAFTKDYNFRQKVDVEMILAGQTLANEYVTLSGGGLPKSEFSNLISKSFKDEKTIIINADILYQLGLVYEISEGFILTGNNNSTIVKNDLQYLKGIAIAERGQDLINNTKESDAGITLILNIIFVFIFIFSITIIFAFSVMSYENNKQTIATFTLVGANRWQINSAYMLNLVFTSLIILIIVLSTSNLFVKIFNFLILTKTKIIMITIDVLLVSCYLLLNFILTNKAAKQNIAIKFLKVRLE